MSARRHTYVSLFAYVCPTSHTRRSIHIHVPDPPLRVHTSYRSTRVYGEQLVFVWVKMFKFLLANDCYDHRIVWYGKSSPFSIYTRCQHDCLTSRVADLERAAFAFGMICLISSIVSVVAGGYGSLAQNEQAIIVASSSALASGVSACLLLVSFCTIPRNYQTALVLLAIAYMRSVFLS